MVTYSPEAKQDLINILYGLITWQKHSLSIEQCEKYVDKIVDIVDQIDQLKIHSICKYETHKKYGNHCYKYEINNRTNWYIVYNWNEAENIVHVNKVISNYITIE